MRWFLDLSTRGKLFAGFGMMVTLLAMQNIQQASAQNVASTKQAETAARNLHELGVKLKQLVEQYQV